MANDKTSKSRKSVIYSVRERLIADVGSYLGKCCRKRESLTTMSIVYDPRSAYHWLLQQLTQSGELEEAGYLRQDGFQGAETALQVVAAQVAIRDGREFQTHGMQQATIFYHATAVTPPFEELCDE
jgi:hypothetical protein